MREVTAVSERVSGYFGHDYASARRLFLTAVADAGGQAESRRLPGHAGPQGEELAMDVARFGPTDASRVLFVTSATHGTEGLTGSGVQVGLLRTGLLKTLPSGTAVVLAHAINPYGFAHLHRTNEDNIDLNRNFRDFGQPVPENSAYPRLHEHILPADWDGPAREAADAALRDLDRDNGVGWVEAAVLRGQYTHAQGLFFGGTAPCWSNREWRSVVRTHAGSARQVALLDIHTGLGPCGLAEPIYMGDRAGWERAQRWFGPSVVWHGGGQDGQSRLTGPILAALAEELPQAETTGVMIEYGTRPFETVLTALRADNWQRFRGQAGSMQGQQIKAALRDALYVDEDGWRKLVWGQAKTATEQALAGLSQQDP